MAYCKNCGTQVSGETRFCQSCGAPVAAGGGPEPARSRAGTAGRAAAGANDAADNRMMAILAYIGFLVFIPIFAAKNSKFARYHSNQGLVLFIIELIYGIVVAIINSVMLFSFWQWGAWAVLSVVFGLVWILFAVLSILGILNAYRGVEKPLPLIGGIKILK